MLAFVFHTESGCDRSSLLERRGSQRSVKERGERVEYEGISLIFFEHPWLKQELSVGMND